MQWFIGEPETGQTPMKTVMLHWKCPSCPTGQMVYNGVMWPTSEGGYHHVCNVCGIQWACRGQYFPRIAHIPADPTNGGT